MIFVPGNVPSLKNSKQMAKTKDGKPVLLYSKTVKKYLQNLGIQLLSSKDGIVEYKTRPNVFKTKINGFFDNPVYPEVIGFNFIRDSMRKFDFHNAVQILADLIVAHGFLRDDDMNSFIPVPMMINGSFYSVCKNNPGVYIKRIKHNINELSFDIDDF